MHTWYHAVCDECKEQCVVLVTSTFHIQHQFTTENGKEKLVMDFLSRHFSHKVRLVHDNNGEEMDFILENNYYDAFYQRFPKKLKQ